MALEQRVAELRRELPWARWGKVAFLLVVLQGLLLQATVGGGGEQPGHTLVLWSAALVYLTVGLSDRVQARLSGRTLLWTVNLLGISLPWLGGGYLSTAVLPAVGLNAILFSTATAATLGLLHGGSALAATLVTLPSATAIPSGYVTVVAVVFVTAFARAVASEAGLRLELSDALRRLQEQRRQAESCAVLTERERIAREVHDSLGHALVAAHVHVRLAGRDLGADHPAAKRALELAQASLETGLTELRGTVRTLAEPSQPLVQTLEQLVETYERLPLCVSLEVAGHPVPLPAHAVLALYRVVQEGLTNVVKHANARHAWVRVVFGQQALRLEVADDGQGSAVVREGFGLHGIRSRMETLGGSLACGCGPGFALRVQLPLG